MLCRLFGNFIKVRLITFGKKIVMSIFAKITGIITGKIVACNLLFVKV